MVYVVGEMQKNKSLSCSKSPLFVKTKTGITEEAALTWVLTDGKGFDGH